MTFKTIIGQVARGDDYFPRPQITDEIWKKLESGSNLLLVAPRRVGKTSILYNLLDKPKKNNIVIYYTSESVNNENEFYKKLFNHIVEELNGIKKYSAKVKSFLKNQLSRIESIGKDGVKLGKSSLVYLEELRKLLENIDLKEDKLIVLIDEFSETVENIIQDESERSAIHFLETKREIRHAPEVQKKIQFVYSGSIGLENIVSSINRMNLINDLAPIPVPPLNENEVKALTDKIINGSGVTFDKGAFKYLLEIIEWWIPFYFQIILDEADKILIDKNATVITREIIDLAVVNALKQRTYFKPWVTRLRKAYKGSDFSFVKELLNIISEKHTIPSNEIYDLAVNYKLENSYKNLINVLKHDGYINNNDNPKIYRFNSPLLREWWNRNVAN